VDWGKQVAEKNKAYHTVAALGKSKCKAVMEWSKKHWVEWNGL